MKKYKLITFTSKEINKIFNVKIKSVDEDDKGKIRFWNYEDEYFDIPRREYKKALGIDLATNTVITNNLFNGITIRFYKEVR